MGAREASPRGTKRSLRRSCCPRAPKPGSTAALICRAGRRLLRPKQDGRAARFYAVIARDTLDQDFAAHRQRFLAEQGYAYRIVDADEVLDPS